MAEHGSKWQKQKENGRNWQKLAADILNLK
jgi:hypothetical protein